MYRTIDCATWDDPWFADLTPPTKLLFLYLVTNRRATACGAFEITARAMAFETGLSAADLAAALDALAPKVQWWPELQVIWVRNFYKWQRANSNSSFATAAQKALAKLPDCVRGAIGGAYPELITGEECHPPATPLPPPRDGGKETVTVTVTEQGGADARADWEAVGHAARHPLSVSDDPAVATGERDYGKTRGQALPPDWGLTPERAVWAQTHCPHVLAPVTATAKFAAHYRTRGDRRSVAGWQAEWEKWMLGDEARVLQDAATRGVKAPTTGAGSGENPHTREYLNMVEARNAARDARNAARRNQGVQ